MKKILAIAIVAIMAFALCIGASARINFDRVSINASTLGEMKGNDIVDGALNIAKGDKVYLLGWAFGDKGGKLKEIVYTINGKEYTCADNYLDRSDVGGAGAPDNGTHSGIGTNDAAFELVGIDKLDKGTYEASIIAKFEDGTQEVYSGLNKIVVGGVAPKKYSVTDADGTPAVWLKEGNETATVKFTTTGSFTALSFQAQYWASCIATKTGSEADWTVELYKFAYNTENTLSKKPVATKTMHSTADNTPAFVFEFDEQKAGTYIVKVTVTNPTHEEEVGGEMKKPYVVLPSTSSPDKTKFEFTGGEFNLSVTGEKVDGEFFAANPAETEAPAGGDDNPGTADAAVIAIAAVACIALAGVVVAKKVK